MHTVECGLATHEKHFDSLYDLLGRSGVQTLDHPFGRTCRAAQVSADGRRLGRHVLGQRPRAHGRPALRERSMEQSCTNHSNTSIVRFQNQNREISKSFYSKNRLPQIDYHVYETICFSPKRYARFKHPATPVRLSYSCCRGELLKLKNK